MYSRIVVGTDGTDRSLIAVDHAARLAAACAAELHVVAAASPRVRSAGTAVRVAGDVTRRHGVHVTEHVRLGEHVSALVAVAELVDADLIVVANKRIAGRVRSVANDLAGQARRSLLIVHTG
jgi:nucleotide-binding universal stress UspA family protein